jgi:hypothetical protein
MRQNPWDQLSFDPLTLDGWNDYFHVFYEFGLAKIGRKRRSER